MTKEKMFGAVMLHGPQRWLIKMVRLGLYRGYIGMMEKKMETTIMENQMEKKMETGIMIIF